eukprot:TRINITY_DN2098_c0_g2_i2.p1 TRINITY_DN2098_c0_g2~~TRINITY_DN2098_c0_g2_i2.p1  ORF type:complete len:320 (-),score=121.59 TRINITY_DN2098_c0_g2_i2:109-1068(-)
MKAVLVLALALAAAAAADYETMFAEWRAQYNKFYQADELATRLRVFTDNAKLVERHNAEGHSWELGLNQFADMTNEEFAQQWLAPARNVSAGTYAAGTVSDVDWRTKGAVTPVKNQGQCGSCWSFSTTGGIEGCAQIATGSLVSLSEQQLVDCAYITEGYDNKGCNGGTQDSAMKYVEKSGLEKESDYPYTGVLGKCAMTASKIVAHITGYKDITKGSESALQQSIEARPTPVSIDATGLQFQLYKSGVYCPTSCSSTSLDHAVLAVGMSTSSGGYYIVKNSWDTTWGISGYIYMCANQNNKCGIATASSYPTGCTVTK